VQVLSRFGLRGHDQLRVLVCDGPVLLAWIGALQPAPFEARQRRMMQRIVPALRRRLIVEHLLTTAPNSRKMLDAALEAIPTAAFVVGARGAIVQTNAAGRAWLDRDRTEVRAALREAVQGATRAPRFDVTCVAGAGGQTCSLAVLRRGAAPPSVHAASAAAYWSFTPRQAEVLALLVDGVSTRTIAGMLKVAERTIEAHLTAMFQRAQVATRAELVARVWSR
jgi:DNA-binding NarL/FixJ family response regulator